MTVGAVLTTPLIDDPDGWSRALPPSFSRRRRPRATPPPPEEVDWSCEHASRTRDEGHLFHVEVFLVPATGEEVTVGRLEDVRRRVHDLSWEVEDVVVTVLPALHDHAAPTGCERGDGTGRLGS